MRLLLLLALALSAQDARFSTDVKLVNVLASVRDREDRIVKDLTKDEFVLQEDGHPQDIRYFTHESDLPLTIGLLVDTSKSQRRALDSERAASYTFLDQVLREGRDRAFVVHFDFSVGLLQDVTPSRDKLRAALDRLRIPLLGSTKLFDAVKWSAENVMMRQQGRKAFILLSDGGEFRSRASIVTAIEYAQRADTIIYSVLFRDNGAAPNATMQRRLDAFRAMGVGYMQRLARETGGGYFEVSEDNPIEKIYKQIEDELRHQYSIAYTSDQPEKNSKYRKILLTTSRKDLVVRTRDGYYAR